MLAQRADGRRSDSERGRRRLVTILVYLAASAASALAACGFVGGSEARDATQPGMEAPIGAAMVAGAATATALERVPNRAKTGAEAATAVSAPDAARASSLSVSPVLPAAKKRAVLVGSSSVRGSFGRIIAADLERWQFQVTRRGIVSAGLARPDFCDLREIMDSMPIDQDTAAVFVYVGMNDGQAIWLRPSERERERERWLPWRDRRWSDVYLRRARNLFRSICERGARRALVMLPIEVNKASLERKLQRIRQLQRQAARDTSCAMAVSTAGENGRFVRDGRRLRLRDGFHMTAHGARRVWNRVQRRAFHLGDLPRALASELPLAPARGAGQP